MFSILKIFVTGIEHT